MSEKYHFCEDHSSEGLGKDCIRGHTFIQCRFDHCVFDKEKQFQFYGAVFYGCSFRSIEAEEFRFSHMTFRDCDFMHANLRGSTWYRTQAIKCDFTWSDFSGADTKGLFGEGSEFKLSNIQKAFRVNVFDREMISEIIRSKAKGDVETLMIASLVKNSMEFCWKEWSLISKMPQWESVGKKIYSVLKEYPYILKAIDTELIGG